MSKKKPNGTEVINFYEKMPAEMKPKAENPNEHLHHMSLPFRMCIVAPSGSGKTNFLLNLIHLFSQGKGTFETIHIITRIADEPLYNFLKSKSESIQILEGMSKTPELNKFDKTENHLVIWDDLVLSKDLARVEEYYLRARKQNVSCIFISQSYYHIPTMIRRNSSYMVILKLGASSRELKCLMSEMAAFMDKDQLVNLYEYATDTKFVPLIVNVEETNKYRKFRKGFNEVLNPDLFIIE
jgi:hypothetical protein